MDQKNKSGNVSRFMFFLTVLLGAGYMIGYDVGKDLALKHNAQDLKTIEQFEIPQK